MFGVYIGCYNPHVGPWAKKCCSRGRDKQADEVIDTKHAHALLSAVSLILARLCPLFISPFRIFSRSNVGNSFGEILPSHRMFNDSARAQLSSIMAVCFAKVHALLCEWIVIAAHATMVVCPNFCIRIPCHSCSRNPAFCS